MKREGGRGEREGERERRERGRQEIKEDCEKGRYISFRATDRKFYGS